MKTLRDTWLVFQRALGQTLRTPVLMAATLAQPLIFLFLFGPLLKNGLKTQGTQNVFNVYIPGLMVQLALFASLFACFSLTGEIHNGVIERFRVSPISRFALLLGRTLRDMVILTLQGALITLPAIPMGLHLYPLEWFEMLGVIALLALTLSPISYALGLLIQRDEVLGPLINMVTIPLLLLSGILLPMSYAPTWLRVVSRINPLTEVVDGGRALFTGQAWDGTIALAVLLAGSLSVVSLALVGRLFMRAAR